MDSTRLSAIIIPQPNVLGKNVDEVLSTVYFRSYRKCNNTRSIKYSSAFMNAEADNRVSAQVNAIYGACFISFS